MTDDKEDKTLEHQEHFTEVAKSRDVEVNQFSFFKTKYKFFKHSNIIYGFKNVFSFNFVGARRQNSVYGICWKLGACAKKWRAVAASIPSFPGEQGSFHSPN